MQKIHNKSHDGTLEKRLDDILQLLYSFYDQEIDMSLERVERFLNQLGSPHLKLPPVIHVAGTNGKGSTIAALRSLLEASGKTVHVMTSPHLVHPTERIRLAGELISTEALIDVLEECLNVNRSEPITFFEMFTAATYLAMSRVPADFALLETGMGGRLDATNVVPDPVCTIITTISKDHEKFLGNRLTDIAFEKAGIMKAGVPCVTGYQTQEATDAGVMDVFHAQSKSLSPEAKLYSHGSEWDVDAVQDDLKFTFKEGGQEESIPVPRPNLLGEHQIYNCGAALAAYRIIMNRDFDAQILSPDNPQNPLWNIHWPGRLQRVENTALNKLIPKNAEVWIDGGHNDSAGVFLGRQAKRWLEEDGKKLHLVVAMVNRKDPKAFLEPLIPYAQSITLTEIAGEASSYSAEDLYELVKPMGFKNISTAKTVQNALTNIEADENSRVLIAGSLYFLGSVLSTL